MASKKISEQDRLCISGCIFKYWGGSEASADTDRREGDYESCLEKCRICG
jgi:hypothetical protein